MNTLRKIRGWKSNKKLLLNFNGYNTIQQAKREYIDFTDEQIYEIFKINYNKQIDDLRKEDKTKTKQYKKSPLAFINTEIIPKMGQVTKKTNRGDKRPYYVIIENSIKAFNIRNPSKIEDKREIVNSNSEGETLIIWASNKEEAREKAMEINKLKYSHQWDGRGEFFITRHNEEFEGKDYTVITDSIDNIYILDATNIQITLPPKKHRRNILDEPMREASPYQAGFLKHFNNIDKCSYTDNKGECVLKTLDDVLNRDKRYFTLKFLTQKFNEASLMLYHREYKKKHGITSRMLYTVCKKLNISLLGFNSNNKEFVRNTPDRSRRQYKAIVFYMTLNHFYIITDTNIINSLTRANCDFITDLSIETEERKEKEFFENFENFDELPKNSVNIINDDLDEILTKMINDKFIPKVKYSSLSKVKTITLKNGASLVNPGTSELTTDIIKNVCNSAGINFNNQSIGTLLNDLETNFFKPKRVTISNDLKELILEEQAGKCIDCDKVLTDDGHLDHFIPVSNGGTNDRNNLRYLCKTCHVEKSREEHSEYIKRGTFSSCLNLQASQILFSNFSRKVAFSHYLIDKNEREKFEDLIGVQSIDKNGCRKNISLNNEFYKYSVLDNWEPFDGILEDGNYYIETDDYSLYHKSGVYCKEIVEFGILEKIISLNDIKYQYKPSSMIDKEDIKKFINYLEQTFKKMGLDKLMINSWIGLLGRRDGIIIEQSFVGKGDISSLSEIYEKYNNPYINDFGEVLSITNTKNYKSLDTNFYIHSKILDVEAMELYKLKEKIKNVGGTPICVKTDCVVFYHETLKPLDIQNEFWDDNEKVLKYKYEKNPALLKNEVICHCGDKKMEIEPSIYQEYNEDITIDEIINSNKGLLLLGPAGTGKSFKVGQMCEKLTEMGKTFGKMAPTNKAARIIGGETLDKVCAKILKSKTGLNKFKHLDYIFIDEISMVRETFYQVLIMLKHSNPKIKFIISGDFYQLDVVKDRITNRSYEKSRVLFELVDGNKLTLTKCKRSNDELFNLCETVKNGGKIDISQFGNEKCFINICHTNAKRKAINEERLEEFIKNKNLETIQHLEIKKLRYDDNSQDYILMVGVPLMARINQKSLKIFNNERFIVDKILMNNDIIVSNSNGDKFNIKYNQISKLFYLAFCITAYKSQGETINEKYTIYEWSKFDKKLKYVTLSRATDKKNINIIY